MTTIEKLSISGIRSYDPNSQVTIRFFKPITLIVGKNGSGKTTLIEALRFVCAGQNPPDSLKGKSFVHDPLIIGESIVRAQIKLSLLTIEDKLVTIIRSFQLTQKNRSRRYQQIDATIRSVNNQGEKITASHKCAEIDAMAARIMKVSKAIISNVIFCHQEESLWPLSDPKSLKLKFDEIFASTKYTKALDKLKTIKKNVKSKIAFLEKDLILAKTNLQNYNKSKLELEKSRKEIEILDQTIESLRNDINQSDLTLEKLEKINTIIESKRNDIKELKYKGDCIEREKREFGTIPSELDQKSSETLVEMKNQIQVKSDALSSQIQTSEEKLDHLEKKIKLIKEDHDDCIENIGKLQAEENINENNTNLLIEKATNLSQKYNFNQKIDKNDDKKEENAKNGQKNNEKNGENNAKKANQIILTKISNLIEFLINKFSEIQIKFQKEQEKYFNNEEKININLNEIKKEHAMNEQSYIEWEKEKKVKEIELKNSENEEKAVKKAENKLKESINQIKSVSENLNKIEQKIFKNDQNHKIDELEKILQDKKQKLDVINSKIEMIKINEEKIKETNQKKGKLAELEKELSKALIVSKKLLHSLDSNAKVSKTGDFHHFYEIFVKQKISEFNRNKEKVEKQIRDVKQTFGACSGKIMFSNDEKERILANFNEKENQIPKNFALKTLESLKKSNISLKKSLEEIQTKIQYDSGAKFVYSKIIDQITKNKKCPICERILYKKDVENISINLKQRIEKFEDKTHSESFHKKASELMTKIESIQKIMPLKKEAMDLKKMLKEKDCEIDLLQKEMDDTEKRLLKNENEEIEMKKKQKNLTQILADAENLTRLFNLFEKAKIDFEQNQYDIEQNYGIENFEKTQNERQKLIKAIDETNNRIIFLKKEKENLFSEKHKFITKLGELQKEEGEIQIIKEREIQLIKKIDNIKNRIEQIKKKEIEIKKAKNDKQIKIEKISNEIKKAKIDFKIQTSKFEEEKNLLDKEISKIKELFATVEHFKKRENERKKFLNLFKLKKEEKTRLESFFQEETKGYKMAQAELLKLDKHLTILTETLKIRKKEMELNDIKKKIYEIEEEINNIPENESISDYLSKQKEKSLKLNHNLSEAVGRKSAFSDQAENLRKSIHGNKSFDNIEESFSLTQIDLEANFAAFKDLEIYQKALDKALIEYHSMKMKEINRILKRYWKLIYKNNDIDYIEILSSTAEAKSISTTANRNYDYFVVMVKGSAKIEMRGRCSSGQKVLASLLIRLSLAESFCANCNVLALDEPTTNLDDENAKSFANSLKEIIKSKRKLRDFQLILITHNEKFAESLGEGFVDNFYRVFKDENGFSKINKVASDVV